MKLEKISFSREELWALMERTGKMMEIVQSLHWKRAYQQLIDAFDRVDAMIARSTIARSTNFTTEVKKETVSKEASQ